MQACCHLPPSDHQRAAKKKIYFSQAVQQPGYFQNQRKSYSCLLCLEGWEVNTYGARNVNAKSLRGSLLQGIDISNVGNVHADVLCALVNTYTVVGLSCDCSSGAVKWLQCRYSLHTFEAINDRVTGWLDAGRCLLQRPPNGAEEAGSTVQGFVMAYIQLCRDDTMTWN